MPGKMNRPKKKGLKNVEMDDQFEKFMKESMSSEESSIDTARIMKMLDPQRRQDNRRSWMNDLEEEDDEEDAGILTGTGSKFMKKKVPKPKPTVADRVEKSVSFSQDVGMSRDSLDDESMGLRMNGDVKRGDPLVPALSLDSTQSRTNTDIKPRDADPTLGYNTLDEQADKARFFKNMEKNSDDTIDYGRLNKALDDSGTIASTLNEHSPDVGRANNNVDVNGYADYTSDEDEAVGKSPPITAVRTGGASEDRDEGSQENKGSMLSKVALLDSLDSTLGTKAAASHETIDSRNMDPIVEGTREEDTNSSERHPTADTNKRPQRVIRKETRFEDEEDGVDGPRVDMVDSTTGRGVTLKTGTALGYTDTSREMEAYHAALAQVGMGTLDDTREFPTLIATSTQKTHDTSDVDNGTASGGFGLKPMAPRRTDRSRTVEDIMREVEQLTGQSNGEFQDTTDDPRGFNLSPAHTGLSSAHHTQGFDLSPAPSRPYPRELTESGDDYDQGFDMSPEDKFLDHDDFPSGMPPKTPPRKSRSRSHPRSQQEELQSPDASPIPAKRKDKKARRSRYTNVRSSGYGQRSPSPKRSHGNTNNSNRHWSPVEIHRQKVKGSENISSVRAELKMPPYHSQPTKHAGSTGGTLNNHAEDSHLLQSVQSFTHYMHDHFGIGVDQNGIVSNKKLDRLQQKLLSDQPDSKLAALEREQALVREVQALQDQVDDARKMLAKRTAEVVSLEREAKHRTEQLKVDHDQEIFRLKQENFVLAAKVSEDASRQDRAVTSEPSGSPRDHQVSLLTREVAEQEKLLAGYQTENERLYSDMKTLQQRSKTTEDSMYRENQRLNTEIANLKEQLTQRDLALRNKGVITGPAAQQQIAAGHHGNGSGPAVLGAGRIAQLEAQLKQSKNREDGFKLEIQTLMTTKRELEHHIQELVTRIEQFESRLQETNALQADNTKKKLLALEQDLERRDQKLRWYAENQELLDNNDKLLRKKDDDIRRLKQKLDNVQSETGRKTAEVKAKTKERSQDAKRIQDLERQVREMEGIIRKRHPNSLPVLMWAASTAPDPRGPDGTQPASAAFLERQVDKLRGELDEKDDENAKSIRVLEQKYNAMKFQYEERITTLESRLSGDIPRVDSSTVGHPHTSATALQRELDSVKDRHRRRQGELEAEVERLKREVVTARNKQAAAVKSAESKINKDSETESQLRIKALQLELANQEQQKQSLRAVVERLEKEKQQLNVQVTRSAGQAAKAQGTKLQNKLTSKTTKGKAGKQTDAEDSTTTDQLPSATDPLPPATEAWKDKEYKPLVFAGQHVSEILQENEQLRQKMDYLQLDIDQQRVTINKLMAESEAQQRCSREDMDDRLQALRSAHQGELQRLLADHAMANSTSRVAELQGKLDTQEVVSRHLKEQLAQCAVDRERLSVLQIRETTLEAQVKHGLEELREARAMHTPEMSHFLSLQAAVRDMEARHRQRERELQAIISSSRSSADVDATVAANTAHWRGVVDGKNTQIEKFRTELDTILGVLRELQQQGVTLPYRAGAATHR